MNVSLNKCVLSTPMSIAAVFRLCCHGGDNPHRGIHAVCGFPLVLVVVGHKRRGRGLNDGGGRVPLHAL